MAIYQTAVAGTTITAAWANNVRDGIVSTFASTSARASAVPSPPESLLTYLSDLHRYEGHDGSQYQPLPFSPAVVKGTDESVASTTLQDDDHLQLPLSLNATYELKVLLYYTAAVPGGVKFGFTFPASTTLTYAIDGYLSGGSFTISKSAISAVSGASGLFIEGAGGLASVDITGTLVTGATAGNLRLQWAQATSSGTASVIKAGSIMRLTRIS